MTRHLLAAIFLLLPGCAANKYFVEDFINSLFFGSSEKRSEREEDDRLRKNGILLVRPEISHKKDFPEHQEDRLPKVILLREEK